MNEIGSGAVRRAVISVLDVLIVALVAWTVSRMVFVRMNGALVSFGLGAFRYYTVLSNVFCAVTCLVSLIWSVTHRGEDLPGRLYVFRLMGTAVVGVTFFVVLTFLGPTMGYRAMFSGVSFWLHLVVPVLAAVEMVLQKPDGAVPFRKTFLAILPTLVYGVFYLGVNAAGWTGRSNPKTDFYGFLRWGWGIGAVFLLAAFLISWLFAALFWKLGRAGRAGRK
ncbi:MAG: Pr6Pr family membrane protein [Lachnospiraceae bacterium]|nr:Pr6Pr family membrane protein [Lachnospiraceae bacterium]